MLKNVLKNDYDVKDTFNYPQFFCSDNCTYSVYNFVWSFLTHFTLNFHFIPSENVRNFLMFSGGVEMEI